MMTLLGYRVIEQLYESSRSFIYRGVRESDRLPVILKTLKQEYPSPEAIARLRLEYTITYSLDVAGVVKAYSLESYPRGLAIVLEDFGGVALSHLLQQRSFTLVEILNLAIQITQILGDIHQQNIIHKDINPSNITLNPATGQVKIIDFGVAACLSRENPTLSSPKVIEGTLAYMSPEQTGRMNRMIDYRTDFYSLGVMLYQLLCDRLPFVTSDALEMVHCHIAKQPIPPQAINPTLPSVISDLVMKLLAKVAENRYQTAWGVQADLQSCLQQLQTHGKIAAFPLAEHDRSDRFQISQKLYGRESEIETLLAAYERVANSNCELILVSGHAGIGKSALVQEIYRPMTQQRGYLIAGKFDPFHREKPYTSLVAAFRDLMRQLLSETAEDIVRWREHLLLALGENGQVIIDAIPEVQLILGEQPAVPDLPPTAAENRLYPSRG